MAEAILQKALGPESRVASAGSEPAGFVHPLAIAVMQELNLDLSAKTSKHLEGFLDQGVETVITVCGNADQSCPTFPGHVNRHHYPFEDPAHFEGSDEEQLAVFRKVRDEILAVFTAYAHGQLDQNNS